MSGPDHTQYPTALQKEREMLAAIAKSGTGWSWWVWTTDQALIVPNTATHNPNFDAACTAMKSEGWPVFVRQTGGDVTPQADGVVNVSFAFCVPRDPNLSIAMTYRAFCLPFLDYLAETFAITAVLSRVEGSFCDGAYNVVVDGRKLAGTAERWRMTQTPDGEPAVAVLGHMAILSNVDIAGAIAATNAFYRFCQIDRVVCTEKHTSLENLHERARQGQLDAITDANVAKTLAEYLKGYNFSTALDRAWDPDGRSKAGT